MFNYVQDARMCSSTLQRMQVREIGLQLAAKVLSPFLKTGITLAVSHSVGSVHVWRDLSKITLIFGAISSLSSLSSNCLSLSGPAAFPSFRHFRSFKRPLRDISISGITGVELR